MYSPLASSVLLVALGCAQALSIAIPSVQTRAGAITGTVCGNNTAKIWKGIPYAQPPVGRLRFMPPQPLTGLYNNNGSLLATRNPPGCIQWGNSSLNGNDPNPLEDCLYLNVYAPLNSSSRSNLPVKVWAYGGSNEGGSVSYPLYNLCNLGREEIAVSFNYRLGALGFLGLKDAGIDGNMGIKDYVAALQWVQENIAAFGGDPKKVMLFGQSAGAIDTFTVSSLPQAKSLMNAAVMESGGGRDILPYETAQKVGHSYAQTVGCSRSDLACLQSKSVEDLLQAYLDTPVLYEGLSHQVPVAFEVDTPNTTSLATAFVDGTFIARQPLEAGSQVPSIFGSNTDDSSLFTLAGELTDPRELTSADYTNYLSQFANASSEVAAAYPLSLFNQTGNTSLAVLFAITHTTTLALYVCPARKGARATLQHGVPAYVYSFGYTPSCPFLYVDGLAFPTPNYRAVIGATHTAELPFVFGNTDNQPWGNGTCSFTAQERALSKELIGAWTAMAECGQAGTESASWPKYEQCGGTGWNVTSAGMVEVGELNLEECDLWDAVYASMGGVDVTPRGKDACSTGRSGSANGTTRGS